MHWNRALFLLGNLLLLSCEVPVEKYDNPLDKPPAPQLLMPEDGTVLIDSNKVILVWNTVPEAIEYKTEVSEDKGFSRIEFSLTNATDSIITSPLADGRHYWRVHAGNLEGRWGNWSNIGLFYLYVVTDVPFTRVYGGSQPDEARSVQQTSDGGYIIAGWTESYSVDTTDVWLIKSNKYGSEEWNQTYGTSSIDRGHSVQQTTDGGYAIAGVSYSYTTGSDAMWLCKTDAWGNEEWSRTFGGSMGESGYSVWQTTDGGYVIVGETWSYGAGSRDVWLIKTDANGNEEWNKTFGDLNDDRGYSVQQTTDGGYIIAGSTQSYGAGGIDALLVKTDASGNEEWSRTFGGSDMDIGYSVRQTTEGGYIMTGYTASYGAGQSDVWLINIDTGGHEVWSKTFGGPVEDFGYSIQQVADGGYIITGCTRSYGAGGNDALLLKTDASGNEEWSRTFGSLDSDIGYSVQQTTDGGYIIAGYTGSYGAGQGDVLLIKTDANGIALPGEAE
ncbi:MAG: hypothetical protein JSU61_02330 [Fidelibacterota bacterium]|nr:MAG: hypothetical protein JSU61_02330 [Candidatus Neomarinimicrobiota bacterium]